MSGIDSKIKAWLKTEEIAKEAVETERQLRIELFASLFSSPKEGVNKKFIGHYEITGTYKMNYHLGPAPLIDAALDAIEKIGEDGRFVADRLVKWEGRLMVSEYRRLNLRHKAEIDRVLVITPAMPALKIEESE